MNNFNEHLRANLRYLCDFTGSVSEVCRVLDINRQQFNKYLAGSTRPSPRVTSRICDHFGIDDVELALPPQRFKALMRPSHFRGQTTFSRAVMQHLQRLEDASGTRLAEFSGHWFVYYPSFSRPGLILKSLLTMRVQGSVGAFESVERVVTQRRGSSRGSRFIYEGLAFFLRERIFMVAHETTTSGELTEMILFPSYSRGGSQLHGVVLGCSARSTRMPVAAHVVMERVSGGVTRRRGLEACGLFGYDDPAVPTLVRESLRFSPSNDNLLRAFSDP